MAIAHSIAVAIVTSRCPKRIAAQMRNGSVRKVRESGISAAPTPPNMRIAVSASDAPSAIASMSFGNDQRGHPAARQLRMSGATMIIPEASPSHQVHRWTRTSEIGSAWSIASEVTPMVAAIAALSALKPTNLTTSSPLSKRPPSA